MIIYTTLCPRTSLIFVSTTSRNTRAKSSKKPVEGSYFDNKLLAKLEGHRTSLPPTI